MTPPAEAPPPDQPPAEEPLHRALGLTDDEFEAIGKILGRPPNHLELALYAVMWSEHCSYKSSRLHLRRLPTEGPRVLVGPGENAGVIDAGDGIAVALRIESHNHPSAIEPYQGAATGVGGILRDIFTMGARPLAVMDPLFFGPPDDARQRWLVEGVVSGISGYGNSVGVPTVGGELTFDPCYAQNPLVNVLCMGALPAERLVLGIASGPGNLAVLLGSSTGRDGIGGVSVLASAGFSGEEAGAADDTKRPSVQVGDPFEEKRLIEACLELLDTKLVVGIQDLGGAGLACATSETAARGGVGMDVDVSAVPRREDGMEPWEVMTSESQERMLAIVTPESWPAVADICAKWEVRATVVGTVTAPDPARAGACASATAGTAPCWPTCRRHRSRTTRRSTTAPASRPRRRPAEPLAPPTDCAGDLLALAALAALGVPPVRPPAVLEHRRRPGRRRGAAAAGRARAAPLGRAASRSPPTPIPAPARSTRAAGTALVLAEAVANLACVGATPVAVVNCLNFGNPEHPEVMWQLSECIDGMAESCRALSLPVIGGNVSFYNESGGSDIDPTPVLGVLGLVEAVQALPPGLGWSAGDTVVLLGPRAAADGSFPLEGTRWATERRAHRCGRRAGRRLRRPRGAVRLRGRRSWPRRWAAPPAPALLHAVHDVSGGGLAVALAEMAAPDGVRLCARGGGPGRAVHRAALARRRRDRRPRRGVRPGRRGSGSPRWSSAVPAATASPWAT